MKFKFHESYDYIKWNKHKFTVYIYNIIYNILDARIWYILSQIHWNKLSGINNANIEDYRQIMRLIDDNSLVENNNKQNIIILCKLLKKQSREDEE